MTPEQINAILVASPGVAALVWTVVRLLALIEKQNAAFLEVTKALMAMHPPQAAADAKNLLHPPE